jgi:two-component system cell cycle sensor histidine kinase/response regulator CckA
MDIPQDTILVVDDEPVVLNMCKLALSRAGYEVLAAAGATAALDIFRESGTKISLALLDIRMPVMNGLELAQKLTAVNPGIKILLMSGYSVNEIRQIIGPDNPYRIMWKPFTSESLLRMIQTVIDGSSSAVA